MEYLQYKLDTHTQVYSAYNAYEIIVGFNYGTQHWYTYHGTEIKEHDNDCKGKELWFEEEREAIHQRDPRPAQEHLRSE